MSHDKNRGHREPKKPKKKKPKVPATAHTTAHKDEVKIAGKTAKQ